MSKIKIIKNILEEIAEISKDPTNIIKIIKWIKDSSNLFFDNFQILPRASYHLFRNLDLDNLKDYILTYWLQLLIILIIIYCVIMLFSKNKNDND